MSNIIENILELIATNNVNILILPEAENDEIFIKLNSKYNFDYKELFIWQGKIKCTDILYDQENWDYLWYESLAELEQNIFIVVTDESYYPWKICFGPKETILKIICELPFFEYFIFDNKMDKIIFDTHHNFFRVINA